MNVSRVIAASRSQVFDAFARAESLVAWLPPSGMRGAIEGFALRAGGGYQMTLTYEDEGVRGKTSANHDVINVRFVDVVRDERIVQAIEFLSDDAAFAGTMTMTWTFADDGGGTRVTCSVENAPPGISDEDHDAGIRSSLENLARYVEAA